VPEFRTINMRATLSKKTIRTALRKRLLDRGEQRGKIALFEDAPVCGGVSRIDFLLVGGTLHGFEVKSDGDSLARLRDQERSYSMALEKVTLVIGNRHVDRSVRVIPTWWGFPRTLCDVLIGTGP
jgi:hypothetical protein